MITLRIGLLSLLWCLLTREFSLANLALGLVISTLLLGFIGGWKKLVGTEDRAARPRATIPVLGRRLVLRPLMTLELILFFTWEILVSNVRIALLVIHPGLPLRLKIIAVPVETESEEELALISDLVTLTPGTLTLDVGDDGKTLLVHVLSAEDPEPVRRQIEQGLVRRVRRLFA